MTGTGASRVIACSAVLGALVSLSACSSSSKHAAASTASAPAPATRWWSNADVSVGSTVNPNSPAAAAAKLQPSRTDYCGMLKQTVASNTVLSGLHPGDTKFQTSAQAFIAEIEKVAPANVQPAWQTLGPVILTILRHGAASASSINTAQNLLAAQTIASDAKNTCGVDLTKVITAATK